MEAIDFISLITKHGATAAAAIYFAYMHHKGQNKLFKLVDDLGAFLRKQAEENKSVQVLAEQVHDQCKRISRVEILVDEKTPS